MYIKLFVVVLAILINMMNCEDIHKPNILIIIADDLGIGDVGCYGNDSIRTPNIDSLVDEGIKLTHHFSAAAVCSPSRAALLVGRYPARFGFTGTGLGPPAMYHVATSAHLPYSEVTIAEALSTANYSTGIVGKWHLGSECEMFGLRCPGPLNHGFSFFFGIPFSLIEDMEGDDPFFDFSSFDISDLFLQGILAGIIVVAITWLVCLRKKLYIHFVILVVISVPMVFCSWFAYTHLRLHTKYWFKASSWFHQNMNEVTVRNGIPEKQTLVFDTLSEQMVNESVKFINKESNKETPFFLIHAFLHVHTPMFTAKKNAGRSCCGRYGDNVEEMDDGVGALIEALKDNNVHESTIIYFLSDHGGHLESIDPVDGQRIGGYNKLFKGGKGMGGQEGGIRVPGIIKWHKRLTPNITLDLPISAMDIMPTLLELVGLPAVHELVPSENVLDGRSFAEYLLDSDKSPADDRVFLHHCERQIHAVRLRTGKKIYKMHLARPNWTENSTQCGWGRRICKCEESHDISINPVLFELRSDPYEDYPIPSGSYEYGEVVSKLQKYVSEWKLNTSYAEPIFSHFDNTVWIPWRQPFCIWNW